MSNMIQEISGFFIVESYVLETAGIFRSSRDVEELWDSFVGRLTSAIECALETETDPESHLKVKESLSNFKMIVEVCSWLNVIKAAL